MSYPGKAPAGRPKVRATIPDEIWTLIEADMRILEQHQAAGGMTALDDPEASTESLVWTAALIITELTRRSQEQS